MTDPSGDPVEFNLKLSVGDEQVEFCAQVPTAPIRPVELLPVLQSLDNAMVEAAAKQVEQEGKTISCCAGCGACCRQMVPISEIEAWHLAELVASMPADRQLRVREKFHEALRALEGSGMLERVRESPQIEDTDERVQLGIEYFRQGIPCPFLEDESCSIHPDRPLSCREFLVTSPAENCSSPEPDKIERVPLPATLSNVLHRFSDGRGDGSVRWMPLVLALEWVAAQDAPPEPRLPGDTMFRNFLRHASREGE